MRKLTMKDQGGQTELSLTLKVHQSVSVEVCILQDLVDLPVGHLLSHQLLHGLTQLRQTDLTIAIGVKLCKKQREVRTSHYEKTSVVQCKALPTSTKTVEGEKVTNIRMTSPQVSLTAEIQS